MGFSLSGREAWVGAFLIVDHFPSPSASTRRVFRWLLLRAGPVDRRDFQSDILLWYGRKYQRTETSSPSLLAASLKVKRNSAHAHGWAPVPDRPNIHSNRIPRRLSLLNMYVFWPFKITRMRHPNKRPQTREVTPYFAG